MCPPLKRKQRKKYCVKNNGNRNHKSASGFIVKQLYTHIYHEIIYIYLITDELAIYVCIHISNYIKIYTHLQKHIYKARKTIKFVRDLRFSEEEQQNSHQNIQLN